MLIKYSFIPILFLLPCVKAYGNQEYAPNIVPQLTIHNVTERFLPSYCSVKQLANLTNAVKQCYATTYEHSPEIDICILGDRLLSKIYYSMRELNLDNGEADPSNAIPYLSLKAYHIRFTYYQKLKRFSKLHEEKIQFSNYLQTAVRQIHNEIALKCMQTKSKNIQ